MNNTLPIRKPTRSQKINYNAQGVYFITICTEGRKKILSSITEKNTDNGTPTVKLLPHGVVAKKHLDRLSDFYTNITVDQYVIMPNHIHVVLFVWNNETVISESGPSGTSASTNYNRTNGPSRTSASTNYNRTNGPSRTSAPTVCGSNEPKGRQHAAVSRFVSTFKRFCNKEYGGNVWQRSFHDHVIRSREDYEKHARYIHENPETWFYDELYSAE